MNVDEEEQWKVVDFVEDFYGRTGDYINNIREKGLIVDYYLFEKIMVYTIQIRTISIPRKHLMNTNSLNNDEN